VNIPDSQNHLLVLVLFGEKIRIKERLVSVFSKHLKELANFVKEPVKTQWGFMARHFLILCKNLEKHDYEF
jgi:hypothetical protein